MRTRIKFLAGKSLVKQETDTPLTEITYTPNLLNDADAKINLCFKKEGASGIIELSLREIEAINKIIATEKALRTTKHK